MSEDEALDSLKNVLAESYTDVAWGDVFSIY